MNAGSDRSATAVLDPMRIATPESILAYLFKYSSKEEQIMCGRSHNGCDLCNKSDATIGDKSTISNRRKIMTLAITSTAFEDGGPMASKYTCEGANIAPPLTWTGVPEGARSLALIVDDPDAPDPAAPTMTYVHWVVYNLPVDCEGLPEGATSGDLPPGTLEGTNDWQRIGYGGPCPPIGRHRYFHKLFALDVVLDDLKKPTKDELLAAMAGHVVAQAQIVGTYRKGQ
jgi:Raf kinase inhibitor-like YbhB/YbcL family protein